MVLNMLKNKAIFAVGATFLFLAVAMIPASASVTKDTLFDQERESVTAALNRLMDKIETAENFAEVRAIIKDFCSTEMVGMFPILIEILKKILEWTFSQRRFSFADGVIGNIFSNRLFDDRSKGKFITSFGSYNKLLPNKKDEKITLFKQGFAFWHYSGKAKLSKGRTLIIERQPFNIKQQLSGAQFGFITGFKGLHIDVESKLTGNSYVFIMGNARRARAFGLGLFSD